MSLEAGLLYHFHYRRRNAFTDGLRYYIILRTIRASHVLETEIIK